MYTSNSKNTISGGNADVPLVWGSRNGPWMQAVHFAFSVGALSSPIATQPFLSKQSNPCINDNNDIQRHVDESLTHPDSVANLSIVADSLLSSGGSISDDLVSNGTLPDLCDEVISNKSIFYAFLVSAILTLSATVGFMLVYLKAGNTDLRLSKQATDTGEHVKPAPVTASVDNKKSLSWKIVFLTLLAILIALQSVVEESFPGFFMSFAQDYLKWDVSMNVLAITVFWMSFAIGRFCGIFIVSCCNHTNMLTTYFYLLGVAFTMFLVSTQSMFEPFILVSISTIGFSMSVVFPAILSWTSNEIIHVSGKVSGLFMTAASFGGMVFPPLVGHLMEHMHPMWYVYILTTTVGLTLTIYLIIKILLKIYGSTKSTRCMS